MMTDRQMMTLEIAYQSTRVQPEAVEFECGVDTRRAVEVIRQCVAKGWLTKAGALTEKGKSAMNESHVAAKAAAAPSVPVAKKKSNSHFQSKGRFRETGPTYICRSCGKRTRETGEGERDLELCAFCLMTEYANNAWYDGAQDDAAWAEYEAEIARLEKKYGRTYESKLVRA